MDTLATIAEASGLDKQESLKVINDKMRMQMMLELMKRLLSNIKFRECLILLLIKSMLFQVKLLLVHFSKCGKKNPAPKLQELSSEGGSDLSCTDGSCSVPSKEQ